MSVLKGFYINNLDQNISDTAWLLAAHTSATTTHTYLVREIIHRLQTSFLQLLLSTKQDK